MNLLTTITLNMPAPPSMNRLWRHSGKRVYLDPRYVAWKREAGWEAMAKRPGRFPPGTAISMTVKIGKSRRARDVDNYGKALCDLVQSIGIVANDRDIAKLTIARDDSVEPGRVQVQIRATERAAA